MCAGEASSYCPARTHCFLLIQHPPFTIDEKFRCSALYCCFLGAEFG